MNLEGKYVLSIVNAILKRDVKKVYESAQLITGCQFTEDLVSLATEIMDYSDIKELCDTLNVPQEWFEQYYEPEWEE